VLSNWRAVLAAIGGNDSEPDQPAIDPTSHAETKSCLECGKDCDHGRKRPAAVRMARQNQYRRGAQAERADGLRKTFGRTGNHAHTGNFRRKIQRDSCEQRVAGAKPPTQRETCRQAWQKPRRPREQGRSDQGRNRCGKDSRRAFVDFVREAKWARHRLSYNRAPRHRQGVVRRILAWLRREGPRFEASRAAILIFVAMHPRGICDHSLGSQFQRARFSCCTRRCT
jgi:hypothetical protein